MSTERETAAGATVFDVIFETLREFEGAKWTEGPRSFAGELARKAAARIAALAPQPRSTEGAAHQEREELVERLNQVAAALDRRAVIHDDSGLPRLGDGLRQEAITAREAARALASPAEASEPRKTPRDYALTAMELMAPCFNQKDAIQVLEAQFADAMRAAEATERPAQGEAEPEQWVCPSCRAVMCYDPGMICPCCGTTMDRRAERAEPDGALRRAWDIHWLQNILDRAREGEPTQAEPAWAYDRLIVLASSLLDEVASAPQRAGELESAIRSACLLLTDDLGVGDGRTLTLEKVRAAYEVLYNAVAAPQRAGTEGEKGERP